MGFFFHLLFLGFLGGIFCFGQEEYDDLYEEDEFIENKGLNQLSGIKGIRGLSQLSGIKGLSGLGQLNGLNGLNQLNEFNDFSGLSGYSGFNRYIGPSVPYGPYYYDPRQSINALGNLNLFAFDGSCTTKSFLSPNFEKGQCMNYVSCLLRGQRVGGLCHGGIKACCIPRTKRVRNNSPSTNTVKTYTIRQLAPKYCQVRLDFKTLILDDPDVNGNCNDGSLVISGSKYDTNVPTICGTNTGQHMYLTFRGLLKPISMTITTANAAGTSAWDIKTSRILCTDRVNQAPANCLQYFNTATGSVMSFNFDTSETDDTTITRQLANMNYKICIESSLGTAVNWTKPSAASTAPTNVFTINGNASLSAANLGEEELLTVGSECTTDYVIIIGGSYTNSSGDPDSNDRFCGLGFPNEGISTTSFELTYITNDEEEADGDSGNAGFYLTYTVSGSTSALTNFAVNKFPSVSALIQQALIGG